MIRLLIVASFGLAGCLGPDTTIVLPGDITTGAMKAYEIGNDTVLDLNGYTIRCSQPDPGTALTFGIYAPGTTNVTIKNGSISGCMFGVHGGGSRNITIENVDFSGSTYIGVHLSSATGAVVRGSTFREISGYELESYAIGVNGVGSNAIIEKNVFAELYRQSNSPGDIEGEGVAILVGSGSVNVEIRNNRLINEVETVYPSSIGIWVARNVESVVIESNIISGFASAIKGNGNPGSDIVVINNTIIMRTLKWNSIGVGFENCYTEGSDGRCTARNNSFINFSTPLLSGVTDAGGNIITP